MKNTQLYIDVSGAIENDGFPLTGLYVDAGFTDAWDGGDLWYSISDVSGANGVISVQINNQGHIISGELAPEATTTTAAPTTTTAAPTTTTTTTLAPASAVFVGGNAPDWNQPEWYANNSFVSAPTHILDVNTHYYLGTEPNADFKNWCAPAAAACQLGHLVDNAGVSTNGTPQISDLIAAGLPQINSDHLNSTIPWDTDSSWGDWMIDGPTFRTDTAGTTDNCSLTDIGWWMNTNLMGKAGGVIGTSPGTTVNNIFGGLRDFYKHAGWTVDGTNDPVAMAYHKMIGVTPVAPGLGVLPPSIDVGTNAELDSTQVFSAFKHQIDTNKTVLACFAGWSISASAFSDASVSTDQEPDIRYYNIDAFTAVNNDLNETYTQDNITDGEAIGHTVCVVGYIEAGTADDPTGNTNWLIVRDNDHNTVRNVAIPFDNVVNGSRSAWDALLATVYANPVFFTQPICPTTTTTAAPTTTTTTTAAPSTQQITINGEVATLEKSLANIGGTDYRPSAFGFTDFTIVSNSNPQGNIWINYDSAYPKPDSYSASSSDGLARLEKASSTSVYLEHVLNYQAPFEAPTQGLLAGTSVTFTIQYS